MSLITISAVNCGEAYPYGGVLPSVSRFSSGCGCPACGNLANCVCELRKQHRADCRFLRAASLGVELACDHGFQACPECDPCTCEVADTVWGQIPIGGSV